MSASYLPWIAAEELARDAQPPLVPLMVVDLASAPTNRFALRLPPCPVLAVGDPHHWLAAQCDAVIDTPIAIGTIMAGILAQPAAAAVIVQLLRVLPRLSPEDGLTVESLAYATLQASTGHLQWLIERRVAPARAAGAIELARDDDTLAITLDRPQAGNAIDRAMRDALHEALALASADRTIARVVLRGAGKAFCLGADLAEFGTTADPRHRARYPRAHAARAHGDRLRRPARGARARRLRRRGAGAGRVRPADHRQRERLVPASRARHGPAAGRGGLRSGDAADRPPARGAADAIGPADLRAPGARLGLIDAIVEEPA